MRRGGRLFFPPNKMYRWRKGNTYEVKVSGFLVESTVTLGEDQKTNQVHGRSSGGLAQGSHLIFWTHNVKSSHFYLCEFSNFQVNDNNLYCA
jgi:hypothetical protein